MSCLGNPITTALHPDGIKAHPDTLRVKTRKAVDVRVVGPSDRENLRRYFGSLSIGSRYNRFLGAINEVSASQIDRFVDIRGANQFTAVATMLTDGSVTIVGEACCAFHVGTSSVEIGLSVDDRWRRYGVGKALLTHLERRAAACGARRIFGDTLHSNKLVIDLARRFGYVSTRSHGDWKLVRLVKAIAEQQDNPSRNCG
jgi:ribosomal protein S18 acetylase RimI-like enzyme